MRDPRLIVPASPRESYAHEHDLLELYAADRNSLIHRRYIERISWIMGTVKRYCAPGGTVLEIGSAQGNMSLLLAEDGYKTVAADIDADFLNYSRKKYERGDVEWIHGDAFQLPMGRTFDAVILAEIIEHVAHPQDLIGKALKLVRSGGVLVIATPNHHMRDRTPSFQEATKNISSMERSQFGPGGESHLFTLTMGQLKAMIPRTACVVESAFVSTILCNNRVQRFWNVPTLRVPFWAANIALPHIPWVRSKVSLQLMVVVRNSS
ncbi:MAG: methyltransferase domain-containing protein [Chloroflexi bacterium]|nr:methyltransferase domain-containing protein [Chloroflexota bacterium]